MAKGLIKSSMVATTALVLGSSFSTITAKQREELSQRAARQHAEKVLAFGCNTSSADAGELAPDDRQYRF